MSLLEQNISKKARMDKNMIELSTDKNKKYKIEVI